MRIFILLSSITLLGLTPKHVASQNEKIVIDADKELTVDEVFKLVKKQTDYMFVYHRDLFKDFPKVNLKKGSVKLRRLLDYSLFGSHVDFIFTKNNTILIKEKSKETKFRQRRVSGTVTDQSGLPVSGATISIKGTAKGTIANLDGQYTIIVPNAENVLVYSSMGLESQEITVGNQNIINVVLKESLSKLDAVTITGRYYNTPPIKETGSVSEVDSKIIERQPVNNPIAAIVGHVPGVDILPLSGVPGGNFIIQIRGQSFIDPDGILGLANAPLYVVDGVPYDAGSLESPQTSVDIIQGGFVSPLNSINPSDIENIEILKGADATAIYGSRGANGVIHITTKKGKAGKLRIKLNVSTSLSEVTDFVNLLNTDQYLEMRKEAFINDGLWPVATDDQEKYPDLFLWDPTRYTDWQEVLIGGTAHRNNTQLSFSGGSDQTQFLLSSGYSSETTIFPGDSKYSKASVHLNLNHRSANNRFSINFSANYVAGNNSLIGTDFTALSRTLPPNAPALYNEDGSLNWENSTWDNPLGILESDYKSLTHNLVANSVLSYKLIPSLEVKTSIGFNDYRLESYWARPHTMFDPDSQRGQSSESSRITTNNGTRKSWIIEPQINWGQDFGDINLKVLLGATFQDKRDTQFGVNASNFSNNKLLLNVVAAEEKFITQDSEIEYKYQAFFGRVNFDWKDKYILNLTGRRDGSSRFGPGRQFGYFGAVGMAWLFSKENLLKNSDVLSLGKLRASYGTTGSDNVPDYAFYDSYEVSGIYNGSGLAPTRLFNPIFAWGTSEKLEAALELGFWKDRVFLSTAWYRNRSSEQLISIPLPGTTGFSGINGNWDAVVDNTGFEVDMRTTNIQSNNFKWSTTFNISFNRNKLVSFPGIEGSTFDGDIVIGEPLSVENRYRAIGVDPETGIYKYEDYNNDGILDEKDRTWRVDLTPKYFGGLGNSFNYKNLKLNVFFQFVKQKGKEYLGFIPPPGQVAQNVPVTALDRWQYAGDVSPIQRYTTSANPDAVEAGNLYFSSSAAVTDASFIRLRTVALNYTIPKTTTKSADINIFLQGQNLFVLTKYKGADPEIQNPIALPPLRQVTLGVNLNF